MPSRRFVDKQVDELVERKVGDLVSADSIDQLLNFVRDV
jgi:hypothetical protein